MFDEREQRDKAKKKPSSSESRPPRSLSHRSPLESISRPRPKDSYNQQPGQSFCRPPKQSPYKSRMGTQSKRKRLPPTGALTTTKDNAIRTGSPRVPSQLAPFTRKIGGGGAEVAWVENTKDQLPVGGKLAHYQAHWTNLFPQHPEIVRKVFQGILIAFDDVPPSLLRYPLELPSNNKTADLLHAVQKLQVSQAIEEVMDTTWPGYYSRLFLVQKPDGFFRPIIDLKKLNQFK